jgi:hypothetical protein
MSCPDVFRTHIYSDGVHGPLLYLFLDRRWNLPFMLTTIHAIDRTPGMRSMKNNFTIHTGNKTVDQPNPFIKSMNLPIPPPLSSRHPLHTPPIKQRPFVPMLGGSRVGDSVNKPLYTT